MMYRLVILPAIEIEAIKSTVPVDSLNIALVAGEGWLEMFPDDIVMIVEEDG